MFAYGPTYLPNFAKLHSKEQVLQKSLMEPKIAFLSVKMEALEDPRAIRPRSTHRILATDSAPYFPKLCKISPFAPKTLIGSICVEKSVRWFFSDTSFALWW